jgi:NAD(P)H-flavin reductase
METTHTDARPAAAGGNPWLSRPYLVRKKSRETADTFTLELTPPAEDGGFIFKPGQFNMLYTFGIGEIPISISGDPAKPETLTHTVRAVGAVSRAIAGLKPGSRLGIRGPYGAGWPVTDITGRDVVIIAGGIGLAPLRPAVHYLLAHRGEYGKIILVYGARTPADIVHRKDLEKWRSRFDIEVLVTVDRATGDWQGNVGVVTTFIGGLRFDPSSCAALVCGPEIMMRFTVMGLRERQVADNSIFISMERNMKCGVGLCGHCQVGPSFVCKDGPVYRLTDMKDVFIKREM